MLDSNVSTYIDKDGNVQEVGGGGLSFPISYTGTATDAKIDLITDYEGSREKYTTITPGVISLGNGMSSSKLEIASLDNGESTYIRFNPTGTLSAELFAKTDDTGSKAVLTVDGNPILASSNVDPEYANTSEIVDNAITLTSTSTLNDLVSQILANKTKVTRSSDMINLDRILGAPKYTTIYGVTFKVVNSRTISDASEPNYYPDLVIECFAWGSGHYYKQYIANYSSWSDAPLSLTGWVELSTHYNPYPVGSIYITTDPSTSPPRVAYVGGTWEQIKDVFLLAAGDTYTAGSTGGSADAVVVAHGHEVRTDDGGNYPNSYVGFSGGATPSISPYASFAYASGNWGDSTQLQAVTIGEDGTGKNLPPYLTVCMWRRIA